MKKDYFLAKKTNKKTALKVLKNIGLLLLVCLVFGVTCYFKGVTSTLFKVVSLFVYCLLGIALFFILYYVCYFISVLSYKSKKKRNKTEDFYKNLGDVLSTKKYEFSYDKDKSVGDNARELLEIFKSLVLNVASSYGAKGRYKMLNFTVYDALSLTKDVLYSTQIKIENVLDSVPIIKLKDKPLDFLEKYLNNALSGEKDEKKEKNVILGFVISKAVPVLKSQIDKEANGLIRYVGEKSFKLYGKKGKKFKPVKFEDVEVVYD